MTPLTHPAEPVVLNRDLHELKGPSFLPLADGALLQILPPDHSSFRKLEYVEAFADGQETIYDL